MRTMLLNKLKWRLKLLYRHIIILLFAYWDFSQHNTYILMTIDNQCKWYTHLSQHTTDRRPPAGSQSCSCSSNRCLCWCTSERSLHCCNYTRLTLTKITHQSNEAEYVSITDHLLKIFVIKLLTCVLFAIPCLGHRKDKRRGSQTIVATVEPDAVKQCQLLYPNYKFYNAIEKSTGISCWIIFAWIIASG